MADISFDSKGRVIFPTKYHGEISFSKKKWDDICSRPERYYYRLNGEKIATTLITPDEVRWHKTEQTQLLYYKEFRTFKIADGIEGPMPAKFMAVVIDTSTQRICTLYPVDKPKKGKVFRPEGA